MNLKICLNILIVLNLNLRYVVRWYKRYTGVLLNYLFLDRQASIRVTNIFKTFSRDKRENYMRSKKFVQSMLCLQTVFSKCKIFYHFLFHF